jgi:hypothetical protein
LTVVEGISQAKEPELVMFAMRHCELVPVSKLFLGMEEGESRIGGQKDVPAIVETGCTILEPGPSAWTRSKEMVPEVEGAHVISNVEPAGIEAGIVAIVKWFAVWAATRLAKALAMKKLERSILECLSLPSTGCVIIEE